RHRARRRQRHDLAGRAPAARIRTDDHPLGLECGARLLRRRARLLSRPRRGRAGARTAPELTSPGLCAEAPQPSSRARYGYGPSVPFRATLPPISSIGRVSDQPREDSFVAMDEQHIALPKLYGAPAYARPVIIVEIAERPFDPDDLPIEAVQTDEEREIAQSLPAHAYAPGGAILHLV